MKIDITVETDISETPRVRQLGAMFDVPASKKCTLTWHGELPIESTDWNVGLIVGPSGCGKSTIARNLFQEHFDIALNWNAKSVIDDFAPAHSIESISEVCQAVGFNTIPAWMRPYSVLSNGERFRVDIARRLLELPSPIVVDEFSSVVDRQVAKIGAHAVQKFVRKNRRQFVAVTCHYDVADYLQPDWVFEPGLMAYTPRGLLQRRPELECTIARVPHAAWQLFAPFHYLSASLHLGARCFALWVDGQIAAFCGVLHRPHPRVHDIIGVSRVVTLPDWQGLGLAFALLDRLGAAHKAIGKRIPELPGAPRIHPVALRIAELAAREETGIQSHFRKQAEIRARRSESARRIQHGGRAPMCGVRILRSGHGAARRATPDRSDVMLLTQGVVWRVGLGRSVVLTRYGDARRIARRVEVEHVEGPGDVGIARRSVSGDSRHRRAQGVQGRINLDARHRHTKPPVDREIIADAHFGVFDPGPNFESFGPGPDFVDVALAHEQQHGADRGDPRDPRNESE